MIRPDMESRHAVQPPPLSATLLDRREFVSRLTLRELSA